ncbi:MAG: hydrogenase maturation nickel metallochaperone HypA [Anaerolineales bacterium]|nr:hydrogenase maturation nickel metallochaperone HypA [Anaerolineales bacterium]MDP2776463.1 hydrogenase maturation nickel metallochaperone HypA [Anaerolineales bacterium]
MHKNPRLSSIINHLLKQPAHKASIQIAVGELTEFNEEQFRQQWNGLVAQTPLAQTKLNIRIVRAEQQCMVCFLKYHPQQKETACPQCGSVGAKILAGEEFYLESI